MPVDESLFDRDMEIIRQRHGAESVHTADEMLDVERIPVESPGLMRITSGGIPIGRMTRIIGGASSGKSLLAVEIVAAAQQIRTKRFPNGLSCMWWDVEKQFDRVLARRHGVDTARLRMGEQTVIEDIAEAMELLLLSVHLHVIDSASFAEATAELARGAHEVERGAHAAAWKRAINRIHTRIDKEQNCLIVIDHTSIDQNTKSEKPLSGRRMEYRSDLSLHMKRGSWLFYNKNGYLDTNDKIKAAEGQGPAGMKEADGQEISVRVAKSRVCRPLRACKMRLDLNQIRFDHLWELADSATYYDEDGEPAHRSGKPPVVSKTSNGFYKVPGYDGSFHGFDAFYENLKKDEMLQQNLRTLMLRVK